MTTGIKYPKDTRVILEVEGVVDSDGDIELIWPGSYVEPKDFDKFKVRVAPVEIRKGGIYKDPAGNTYIGTEAGNVYDGLLIYGKAEYFDDIPVGLREVTAQ